MKPFAITLLLVVMHAGCSLPRAQNEVSPRFAGGIGAQIRENDGIEVVSIALGLPADHAGMKSRDKILKIGGMPTLGLRLPESVILLRGPVGSEVKLLVQSIDRSEPEELTLIRQPIDQEQIEWKEEGIVMRPQFDVQPDELIENEILSPSGIAERPALQITQPDYVAWQSVTNGMSEAQVQKVLGKPGWSHGSNLGPGFLYTWNYGAVLLRSNRFPQPHCFIVLFDDGQVLQTEDPFDGIFSANGLPSKPSLIYPQDEAVFSHYPRNIDLRWYPSSGEYPMKYRIEVSAASSEEEAIVEPGLTTSISGANEVRWRVKAINRRGESPWSEFQTFKFTR